MLHASRTPAAVALDIAQRRANGPSYPPPSPACRFNWRPEPAAGLISYFLGTQTRPN